MRSRFFCFAQKLTWRVLSRNCKILHYRNIPKEAFMNLIRLTHGILFRPIPLCRRRLPVILWSKNLTLVYHTKRQRHHTNAPVRPVPLRRSRPVRPLPGGGVQVAVGPVPVPLLPRCPALRRTEERLPAPLPRPAPLCFGRGAAVSLAARQWPFS